MKKERTMNARTMKENVMRTFILKILGCAGCALAVLMIGACEVPLSPPNQDACAGQAIIRIGTSGNASARSLVPDTLPDFVKYELVFTADGKEDVYRTLETNRDRAAINDSGYAVDLEEAAWTITASAFVAGTSSTFLEAARGTASLTVNAGNPNPSAVIHLEPLPMNGERGILTWHLTLTVDAGNVIVEGSISRIVDGIPELWTYLPSISGSKELASGYYLLKFLLNKDGKSAGIFRTVHIYPGLTTRAEGADFTFTDANFAEQKYLSGTATIENISGGRTVNQVKIQPYQNIDWIVPLADEVLASPVSADSWSWFLSIPGNAKDVYFRVIVEFNGSSEVYRWYGGEETGVPANGKKDIALTAIYSDIIYTVSFNAGVEPQTEGASPPNPYPNGVVSGEPIQLPGGGSMSATEGKSFKGWRTGGTTYPAGAEFIVTGNTVFTAQWGMNGPLPPKPIPAPLPNGKLVNDIASYVERSGNEFTNVYLIYAGIVEDALIFEAGNYDNYEGGSFPWSIEITESASQYESVTNTLSRTITDSTIEADRNYIGGEISGSYAGVSASVKAENENTVTKTKAETNGYSMTSTKSTARSFSRSENFSYNFVDGVSLPGRYRQVVYAKVKVYWEIKTSRDNQTLKSFTPIVIAEEGPGSCKRRRLEYVPFSEEFTYIPPTTSIRIPADFWKTITRPDLKVPLSTMDYSRTFAVNRIITNAGFTRSPNHGKSDTLMFSDIKVPNGTPDGISLDFNAMKQAGYNYVTFDFWLDLKKRSSTKQGVALFSAIPTINTNDTKVSGDDWKTNLVSQSNGWNADVHFIFEKLSTQRFTDRVVILYDSSGSDWEAEDWTIRLTFME